MRPASAPMLRKVAAIPEKVVQEPKPGAAAAAAWL